MASLKELKKIEASLTPNESIVLQKKYSSPKFKFFNDVDQIKAVKVLLLKIHVITGWNLPSDEILNILVDQTLKKILEEYSDLNLDEIEYAFREKGTRVEDWGKEINLNLLDKVLWPYLQNRREVSEKEERLLPPPERKPLPPGAILNQYRFEIETTFQALRKGYHPIIHIYFEETLRKDGLMYEGENVDEFFARKINDPKVKNLYVREESLIKV